MCRKTFKKKNKLLLENEKNRNDIIKKPMDEDKILMNLGVLLIQKRRRQRNNLKVKKKVYTTP